MYPFCNRIILNIFFILLSCLHIHTQCMLNNIAKTHHIIRDGFKHLSLVNGAIEWETGTIRRLYDYGEVFPVYRKDKQNRTFIAKYDNLDKTHQTVRLIHTLFYRIPGSIEAACFGPTTQLYLNPLVTIQTIAHIMAVCESLPPELAIAESDAPIATIQEHFNQLLKPQALLNAHMGQVVLNALQESNPQNTKRIYPPHMVQAILLAFIYKKYSDDRNLLFTFYGELNNNLGKKILIPDINQTAWIKEVFKPARQSTALKEVGKILSYNTNDIADSNIMVSNVSEVYKYDNDPFVFLVHAALKSLYKTIFSKNTEPAPVNTNTFVTIPEAEYSIEQDLDALVYYANQIRSFPTPVGYQTVAYEYAPNKKTPNFPNCMETAFWNLICASAYDAQLNEFNASAIQKSTGVKRIHSTLDGFLSQFSHVSMASSTAAHGAWLSVVCHIPYVAYHRVIDTATSLSSIRSKEKGYITIPEAEHADILYDWLTNNEYQVCKSTQHGYELRPSIRNIIILLNHLLQLNLFTETNPLAQEFMRADFAQAYFPKLCVALNIRGYISTKNVDQLDCTATPLYTTFYFPEVACSISTTAGHGEFCLLSHEQSKEKEELTLKKMLKTINCADNPDISVLVAHMLCRQHIDSDHFKNYSEYNYINLFATPLENTGLDFAHLLTKIIASAAAHTKIDMTNLVLRLAEKQPDSAVRDKMRFRVGHIFMNSLTHNDCNTQQIDYSKIIAIAEENIAYTEESLTLFKKLVEKDQGFKQAIKAAECCINSRDQYLRGLALDLFKTLIHKNQGITEAMQTLKRCESTQSKINLCKMLINKNQDIAEIIQIAEYGMRYGYEKESLDLFKMLINNNYGFAQAAHAASKSLLNDFSPIHTSALDIFQALFNKNEGFKEAIKCACEGIIHKNYRIVQSTVSLFRILIKYDQDFTELIHAAKKSPLYGHRKHEILSLFTDLVKKNQGFQEAIEFAEKCFNTDCCWAMKAEILNLFRALFENNQGFQEAIRIAENNIYYIDKNDPENETIRCRALDLFRILFVNKQGFQEAIHAAQDGVMHTDYRIRRYALYLFQSLVKHDQGFSEAIKAAQKSILHSSTSRDALELFYTLFQKNQGFKEGFDTAEECISNSESYFPKLEILYALFEKNQGFERAAQLAEQWMSIPKSKYNKLSVEIFSALFKKDYGFTHAIRAAEKGIFGETYNRRGSALNLFKMILEKNQGFQEAIDTAKKGIGMLDPDIKISALKLFQALIKKNQAYIEAITAAQKYVDDENDSLKQAARDTFKTLNEQNRANKAGKKTE
jgi:hypothetical protein